MKRKEKKSITLNIQSTDVGSFGLTKSNKPLLMLFTILCNKLECFSLVFLFRQVKYFFARNAKAYSCGALYGALDNARIDAPD